MLMFIMASQILHFMGTDKLEKLNFSRIEHEFSMK